MNQKERVRLLFGPCRAPPLKKGDRATCIFRDCTVIITSWTDARISWPRCRALNSAGGGSGLLVDEELARAVRNEWAVAVKHWWGVSTQAVWRWRKSQWVGRAILWAAGCLFRRQRIRARPRWSGGRWTAEEREQRRRHNAEKDLAAYLTHGHHGPHWTAEDVTWLGQLPDEEIARRTNRTVSAVRQKREELKVANPTNGRWTAEEVALLGTLPDVEVAVQLGRPVGAVTQKRCKLGVPAFRDGRKKKG